MKKFYITLGLMLFYMASYSQTNDLQVVSSAGDYYVGTEITLSWTLGEPVIETFTNGGIMLTQGFQQGDFWTTPEIYTLTLLANPDNIGAELTGFGDYTEGDLVNITASQVVGYSFIGWSGNTEDVDLLDDASEMITSFLMPDRNVTFTANYQLIDYTITVTIVPEGAGTITGDGLYNMGDAVTLTADAETGYEFLNWRIDGSVVSSDNPYTFTMPASNISISAYFIEEGIETYTLTLIADPDNIGAVLTGAGDYIAEEVVNIAASEVSGFAFIGWNGPAPDVALLDDPFAMTTFFPMPDRNIELIATYEPLYTVTLLSYPEIGAILTGANDYLEGDNVNITASAITGYNFIGWTGEAEDVELLNDATALSTSFTMPARDVTLTATYEEIPTYTLTLVANPDNIGAILTGAGNYIEGANVNITAGAITGYSFIGWTGEAEDVGLLNDATALETFFEMPDRNITLTANYEEIPTYTLTLVANPDNIGAILTGAGNYVEGANVNITAGAITGYSFIGWTGEAEDVGLLNDATALETFFEMPDRNITLTANYEAIDYTISIIIYPADAGTATGEGIYNIGDLVSLEATAASGYQFLNWRLGGSVYSSDNPIEFEMPANDLTFTAFFIEEGTETYTLTLIANPDNIGVVLLGSGVYLETEVVNISASEVLGYTFVGWAGDADDVALLDDATALATFLEMPNRDVTLTATYEVEVPPLYTLTLLSDPGDIGAILAGADDYFEGDLVNISTNEVDGYTFNGWTGTTEDVELLVDPLALATSFEMPGRNVTLTATYELDQVVYPIPFTEDFTDVEVSAIPEDWASTHENWGVVASNNAGGVAPEMRFNWSPSATDEFRLHTPYIDGDLDENLYLVFKHMVNDYSGDYNLSVQATIDGTTWGILWELDVEDNVAAEIMEIDLSDYQGEIFMLAFVFNGNSYNINYWYIDDVYVGEYVPPVYYTLTLVANPAAGGTVTGAGEYEEGDEVTVTAAANTGYEFVNWTDASQAVVSTNASFVYTMPAEDVTLTANFEALPTYTLTLAVEPEGAGTVTGAGEYLAGAEVTIVATANEGYRFVNWTDVDEEEVSDLASYVYTMPTEDVTLTANFEEYVTFTVTFNVDMTNADFDPEEDVVYITGSMLEWADPGTLPEDQTMTQVGETMIWTISFELEAGTYAYKYFLNDGWDGGEWIGDPNRTVEVTEDMVVNDIWAYTNVPTNLLSNLHVYPNPFSNFITIANAEMVTRMVITNLIGQVVMDMPMNGSMETIETGNLNNGVYLITFIANNGERVVRKMVKQ